MNDQREGRPLSTAEIATGTPRGDSPDQAQNGDGRSSASGAPSNGAVTPPKAEAAGAATPPGPSEDGRGQQRSAAAKAGEQAEPLVPGGEAESYRGRWIDVQTGFVDEPRRSVEQADQLVAEVIKRVAQVFADERSKLEAQWSRGDEADTEDLRMALRRYRSFFERLLAA